MKSKDLKELRIDKGFLQKEVASLCDISASFYCLVEKGGRMPSLETSKKISDVLNITLDEFYNGLSLATAEYPQRSKGRERR